jgi:hypothetical protein
MIGIGLTFSAGVGVVASMVAVLSWLLLGGDREMIRLVIASSIWAFPIGVAFSGAMAITARGRPFDKLSLPHFAALGAGAGLLLFGVLGVNAWHAWSVSDAIANATIAVLLGGGSAIATLLLARRARPALKSDDESRREDEILSRVLKAPNRVCPQCGYAITTTDAACSNYPWGRIGSACGFDLESWRHELKEGGIPSLPGESNTGTTETAGPDGSIHTAAT